MFKAQRGQATALPGIGILGQPLPEWQGRLLGGPGEQLQMLMRLTCPSPSSPVVKRDGEVAELLAGGQTAVHRVKIPCIQRLVLRAKLFGDQQQVMIRDAVFVEQTDVRIEYVADVKLAIVGEEGIAAGCAVERCRCVVRCLAALK